MRTGAQFNGRGDDFLELFGREQRNRQVVSVGIFGGVLGLQVVDAPLHLFLTGEGPDGVIGDFGNAFFLTRFVVQHNIQAQGRIGQFGDGFGAFVADFGRGTGFKAESLVRCERIPVAVDVPNRGQLGRFGRDDRAGSHVEEQRPVGIRQWLVAVVFDRKTSFEPIFHVREITDQFPRNHQLPPQSTVSSGCLPTAICASDDQKKESGIKTNSHK